MSHFLQDQYKIVFDVARYENLDQKFILFAPLIIIFFAVLSMFALRKVHIFSFDYIYIMFFLDPLFDKNLFDAFYAYQFCHLKRHTSESMNKEVISINQEMERKINRLVFI